MSTEAEAVVADLVNLGTRQLPSSQLASGDESTKGSLIGLFQAFRPDGVPVEAKLNDYPGGAEVAARLDRVYEAVGNFSRSDSMKDAYFIVRVPPHISGGGVQTLADRFSASLAHTCRELALEPELFERAPEARVLEGKPPKNPKSDSEKSLLLKILQKGLAGQIDSIFDTALLGSRLAEPLYFIACDMLLRDYIRWPLMAHEASSVVAGELLDNYFELWRHGVKIRAFSDRQLDFYKPHREDGDLINAGQFAIR